MDVGLGGVIFIWVGFLWPVIVTSLFTIFKNSAVRKRGYFALSLFGGYVSMFIGNFITVGFSNILTSSYLLGNGGESFEKYFSSSMSILGFIFIALPPIFIAFFVSKKKFIV